MHFLSNSPKKSWGLTKMHYLCSPQWCHGRVVRQRSAKPSTAVRFCLAPPKTPFSNAERGFAIYIYGFKHPIGTTQIPSSGLLYAYSPVTVIIILNAGLFIRVVSIFSARALRISAPFLINESPPSLISIKPY